MGVPKYVYTFLERPEEIMPLLLGGEMPAILPAGQRASDYGFWNYVRKKDSGVAEGKNWAHYRRLILNPLSIGLEEQGINTPIARVYAEHGVEIISSGFEPFEISLRGTPEETRARVQVFLNDVLALFPNRRAQGLVFKVCGNEIYGVVPSSHYRQVETL